MNKLTFSHLLTTTFLVLLFTSCLPPSPKADEKQELCFETSDARYEAFLKQVNSGKYIGIVDTIIDTVFYGKGIKVSFIKEDKGGGYPRKSISGSEMYYTQLTRYNKLESKHVILIGKPKKDNCFKIINIAPVAP